MNGNITVLRPLATLDEKRLALLLDKFSTGGELDDSEFADLNDLLMREEAQQAVAA